MELFIFVFGVCVFALTIWGAVMAGGIAMAAPLTSSETGGGQSASASQQTPAPDPANGDGS